MMQLFDHQKKIIQENKKWTGLFLGTGGGKTLTALTLARGMTLIVCPKQQALDATWQNNRDKFKLRHLDGMLVISKETFRRDWESLPKFNTVIIDEAHNHLGFQPDTRQIKNIEYPKTSQLFDATEGYIKKHNPERFYMCSATPASKPMNVYAIAKLFGNEWDFYNFRAKFYIQRKAGFRTIWIPKNTEALKNELAKYIKQLGYVGRLEDWFDVPEQTHITKYFELTPEQKEEIADINNSEADPMVKRTKKRTVENGCIYEMSIEELSSTEDKMIRTSRLIDSYKINYILERAEEFPKMLIFANYTAQVLAIQKALEDAGYRALTLTGQTKDRGSIISEAETISQCIVIAQAGISSGYELKTVPCVIFASKSYRFLDYMQALGRPLRADALKKNLFIHLVVKGGVDEDCHRSIMVGEDFQEKIYEARG